MQYHPVTDEFLHVDLQRLALDEQVRAEVVLDFVDKRLCPGIKIGGVLNVVRRQVKVQCLPSALPRSVQVSLKDYKIGDSVHADSVVLPDGVAMVGIACKEVIATVVGRRAAAKAAAAEQEERK